MPVSQRSCLPSSSSTWCVICCWRCLWLLSCLRRLSVWVSQSVVLSVCLPACVWKPPVTNTTCCVSFLHFFPGKPARSHFYMKRGRRGKLLCSHTCKVQMLYSKDCIVLFWTFINPSAFFPGFLLSLNPVNIVCIFGKKGPVFGECDPDCFLLLMSICILYSFMKDPTMLSIPPSSVSMSLFYITKSRLTLSCAACLCTYVFSFFLVLIFFHALYCPLLK